VGFYEKRDPGFSGVRSSTSLGFAEAGSIKSAESFFTFPTALSTFHAWLVPDSFQVRDKAAVKAKSRFGPI
jgi:hypothetical protein